MKMLSITALGAILAFDLLATANAAETTVRPVPLALDEAKSAWEGPQFVAADRSGNVFLFRAGTFEVYPIGKTGALGEPSRLEGTFTSGNEVRDAALSSGGDRWLVMGGKTVRLFVNGKEKPLPPIHWAAQTVGFRRDVPLFAALPLHFGADANEPKENQTPPWLLQLDDDRWSPFLGLEGVTVADVRKSLKNGAFNDVMADVTVSMISDRQGRLWAARRYAYRLQLFSPGGRLLSEITVDGGKMRKKGESRGIEITRKNPAQNPTAATGDPLKEKPMYHPFTAESILYDLAEGRDGRLYLLVQPKGGALAIDRYDPIESALERVPLTLHFQGSGTLAAGKDALYIASFNSESGRWRIPWEALDQAAWRKVEFQTTGEPE